MSRKPPNNSPCPTCPWRKESEPSGAKIPGFSIKMMRDLVRTIGDGFRPMMGCHYTSTSDPFACIGYIYRDGYQNVATRLYLRAHGLSMDEIDDECAKIGMWETFEQMLAAYEAAQ